MEYYKVLPKEARLQLLIEADYPTILELCSEPLFKDLCQSKILWSEKLKREFGITNNENPQNEYLKEYYNKLENEKAILEKKENDLRFKIGQKLGPLMEKHNEEINKLTTRLNKEAKIEQTRLNNKYGLTENLEKREKIGEWQLLTAFPPLDLKILIVKIHEDMSNNEWGYLWNNLESFGPILRSRTARNLLAINYKNGEDAQKAKEGLKGKYNILY